MSGNWTSDQSEETPYVVLLGAIGSGKSTIVEKVTGKTGRASNEGRSFTKCSDPLWTVGGEFVISDTPGSNALTEKFAHNIWIATAFNFRPVSKIFIVVKGDSTGRLEGVISSIRDFYDRFIDLPNVPLGVIVTHMDRIEWKASDAGYEFDIKSLIQDQFDISDVLFSSNSDSDSDKQILIENILNVCREKLNLTVNHDNFLRLFTGLYKSKDGEVLRKVKREVEEFKKKRTKFNENRKKFNERQQVDLVFEFQAFMTEEIPAAQRRLSEEFGFNFEGQEADNEAAHTSNMSNQMISELRNIRIEALAHQSSHESNDVRKCPHCPEIWNKVEGCEGPTTCGARPSVFNDTRDPSYAKMRTFTFHWNEKTQQLSITETGTKTAHKTAVVAGQEFAGCGKSITWAEMAPVKIPAEFSPTVAVVGTLDVGVLPQIASNFNDTINDRLNSSLEEMTLAPRP